MLKNLSQKASKQDVTLLPQMINDVEEYGIFTLNTDGIVLSWNKGAEKVQGYSAEEVLGKPFAALYEEEVKKPQGYFQELINKAKEQGYFEEEGWRQHKDGRYYWSTIFIVPIYDEDKNLIVYTFISRDLTERKLAAEISEITEASPEHRTLVLATSNILWVRAFDGQFTAPHLQWEHFTGQVWPDYLGFGWLKMHPVEEHEKIRAFWKKVQTLDLKKLKENWEMLQEFSTSCHLQLKTRLWSHIHKEYRYSLTSIVPRFKGKQIINWLGNEKDVHKNTLIKLDLEEASKTQQLILNSARIGLWQWSLTSDRFDLDQNVATYLGIALADFTHCLTQVIACVHPEDKEFFEYTLRWCAQSGKAYQIEFRVIWPDKSVHYIAGRGQVEYDEEIKKPVRLLGSYWDITETKLLFEEQTRVKLAEQQRKQQIEFVDAVCHELRNPLNGIVGNLEELKDILQTLESIHVTQPLQNLMLQQLETKRRQLQESIQIIQECANHQEQVINQVIAIAKIDAQKTPLNITSFSLNAAIEEALALYETPLREKGLVVKCVLPAEEDIWVKSERSSFKQILLNLLSSAVKYSREKTEIKMELCVLSQVQNRICFKIILQDTSPGLSREEKCNLFERYMPVTHHHQASYTSASFELTTSLKLAQVLGGTLNIEGEKAEGRTYHLTFDWEIGIKTVFALCPDQNKLRFFTLDKENISLEKAPETILQGFLPSADSPKWFVENPVLPQGDCGFIALGIERATLVDSLLLLKNNLESRQFISEEIYSALMDTDSDYIAPNATWQELLRARDEQQTLFDSLLREICNEVPEKEIQSLSVEALINWLQEHQQLDTAQALTNQRLAVYQAEDQLRSYCQKPAIFEHYLTVLKNSHLFLGYKTALLYAKQANISLYIWRKNEKNALQLVLADSHQASSVPVFHLLHTSGFTHFNLLSEAASPKPPVSKVNTTAESAKGAVKPDNYKVLIVEDNKINQKVLKLMIEKAGYQTQIAENGIEAVEFFNSIKPAIIFMDIEMPKKDGFTATQEIRALEINNHLPRTPIYAVSAYAREEYQHKAKEIGMDGFLVKPVKAEQIKKILDSYLASGFKPIKTSFSSNLRIS